MEKLKKFNNVRYDFLIESINNMQDSDIECIMEAFDLGKYQRTVKKLMKDLDMHFYSLGTFGVSITALYPVISNFMETGKFDISPTQQNIVLATICALTVLMKENKEKAKKLIDYAAEKGLSKEDLDKVVNQLTNIKGLFSEIARNFGVVISTFSEMLAYVSLLVPFTVVLDSLLKQGKISTELLSQSLPALGVAMGAMAFKLLINRIMHKLEITIKNTGKFQNADNIKPLLINDELKSPILRPEKVQMNYQLH